MDILDYKKALPNKMIDENGKVTDIQGNEATNPVSVYEGMPSLPNKFLNPDGSYSTLNEILAGIVDNDLFVVVQELPETGLENKIYLVPNGKGTFDEYHYHNGKWDPIGTLDISNLATSEDVQNALKEAKSYTDSEVAKIVPLVPMSKYDTIKRRGTTQEFIQSIEALNLPIGTMLLGTCNLSDVEDFSKDEQNPMLAEEIKAEIFEGCINLTMISTDIEPHEWKLSGYGLSTASDWRPSVTENYVNNQIEEKITNTLEGVY